MLQNLIATIREPRFIISRGKSCVPRIITEDLTNWIKLMEASDGE